MLIQRNLLRGAVFSRCQPLFDEMRNFNSRSANVVALVTYPVVQGWNPPMGNVKGHINRKTLHVNL